MKIAIAAEKNNIESDICPTAGRAPFYLFFEDKELIKAIKNPFSVGGGGAGFGVAQMLANEEVNLVISGRFGGNMIRALDKKNIKHKEKEGKVSEALESH